jgi:hypothetical protein
MFGLVFQQRGDNLSKNFSDRYIFQLYTIYSALKINKALSLKPTFQQKFVVRRVPVREETDFALHEQSCGEVGSEFIGDNVPPKRTVTIYGQYREMQIYTLRRMTRKSNVSAILTAD